MGYIWIKAGHGVDFATENFLMDQCEMMTTTEAHHIYAVQCC